tara:strand:- start:3464 stop:3799 length:336 start_codon:yes stop_codon:yes gene_type:complete
MEEFCELIERSIDVAFEQDKYLFRCYTYLKTSKTTRKDVRKFIDSTTANNVTSLISDLEQYIKGGNKVVREAYGHLGKPKARKILKYLTTIINDAVQYEKDRRPGRKKKAK